MLFQFQLGNWGVEVVDDSVAFCARRIRLDRFFYGGVRYRTLIFSLACLANLSRLLAQAPEIHHFEPAALVPGQPHRISLQGEHLEGRARFWTSFEADIEPVRQAAQSDSGNALVLRIHVPENCPVGIGALRLATDSGASDWQLILIDDLPTVSAEPGRHDRQSAQPLAPPVAVEGRTEESRFDYYQFQVDSGQSLSFEVVAHRLGSRLDPLVRLLDANGRELVYCDDEPGVSPDLRFRHRFSQKGTYYLELRDVAYEGGRQHRYRLRVGDFPLAGFPYPVAARSGNALCVTFAGPHVDGLEPVKLFLPEQPTQNPLPVGARFHQDGPAGFVTLLCQELPVDIESEPNDTPETAFPTSYPKGITGRFLEAGDRDYYELKIPEKQRLVFTGQTRRLGSPCDLYMALYSGDQTLLGEADIAGQSPTTLDHTFDQAGTYYLLVEELNRRGGDDLAYWIRVQPFHSGFDLNVESDLIESEPGGTGDLKIRADRRGYKGPISVVLAATNSFISLSNAVIPAGKDEAEIQIQAGPELKPGDLVAFQLRGEAGDPETTSSYTARVHTEPALRSRFPLMHHPPLFLDGRMTLVVKERESE